jgi:hypothetical protein
MPPPSIIYDSIEKAVASGSIQRSTADSYGYSLRRIERACKCQIADVVAHPAKYFSAMEKAVDARATLKTSVAAVLAALKYSGLKASDPDLFHKWYKLYFPLFQEQRDSATSNQPSPRQQASMIAWTEAIAKFEELDKSDKRYASKEHLLLMFYTQLSPRRQEDYFRIRIVRDGEEGGKPDKDASATLRLHASPDRGGTLTVTKYKTADAYKAWEKELDAPFVKAVLRSLQINDREYVFVDAAGKPFANRNSFTQNTNRTFSSLFGRKITVNSLRHAYSTYRNADRTLSLKDRMQDSRDMGHSLETHLSYALHVSSDAETQKKQRTPAKKTEAIPDKILVRRNSRTYVCKKV